ncbi:hypothetical protein ACJX0J_007573, partial [Zea mays]
LEVSRNTPKITKTLITKVVTSTDTTAIYNNIKQHISKFSCVLLKTRAINPKLSVFLNAYPIFLIKNSIYLRTPTHFTKLETNVFFPNDKSIKESTKK